MKMLNKRIFITAAIALITGSGILLSVNQPSKNNPSISCLISEDTVDKDTSAIAILNGIDTTDTSSAATMIFALVDTTEKDTAKLKLNQLYTLLGDTAVSDTAKSNQLLASL